MEDVTRKTVLKNIYIKSSSDFHKWTQPSKMSHSQKRNRTINISVEAVFLSVCIISTLVSPGVLAIKCYECNSKLDPRCGEPFNNFTIALVDCEQQRSNDIPHLDDDLLGIYNRELDKDGKPVEDSDGETVKATSFCRKTLQTINDVPSVIRGCGWVKNFGTLRDRKCFARTGTHQIQMYHCVCEGRDGCNAAEQLTFSLALLLLPLLPAYIFHVSG